MEEQIEKVENTQEEQMIENQVQDNVTETSNTEVQTEKPLIDIPIPIAELFKLTPNSDTGQFDAIGNKLDSVDVVNRLNAIVGLLNAKATLQKRTTQPRIVEDANGKKIKQETEVITGSIELNLIQNFTSQENFIYLIERALELAKML